VSRFVSSGISKRRELFLGEEIEIPNLRRVHRVKYLMTNVDILRTRSTFGVVGIYELKTRFGVPIIFAGTLGWYYKSGDLFSTCDGIPLESQSYKLTIWNRR
jgi:hypothetical protein